MTADIDRDKLRELCERATPGPWESTVCDDGLMMVATTGDTICFGDPNHQEPDDTANGAFIAAARTALPALLDITDAQSAKIAELEAEIERLESVHSITAHECEESESLNSRIATERDNAMDRAANFILDILQETLKVTEFEVCDGTETRDGDVAGTIYNILRLARVLDPETDELATSRITSLESERDQLKAENTKLRERAGATEDRTWFWEIVDRDGLANLPSDERQTLADLCRHSAERDQLRKRVEAQYIAGMKRAADICTAISENHHERGYTMAKSKTGKNKANAAARAGEQIADAILSAASALEQKERE